MIDKIGMVFIGNTVNAALAFLITILLSKILTVEDFGKYGYLYALSVIVGTVLDFASGTAFVIHYNKNRIQDAVLKNYHAFRFTSFLVLGLGSIYLFSVQWDAYTTEGKLFLVTTAMATLVGRHFQFYYQALGNYRDNGIVTVTINAVRSVSVVGLMVLAARGADARLSLVFAVLAAAQILAAVIVFLYSRKGMHWGMSFRFDEGMLRTIGYLGLSNILIIITMRIDIFFIKYYLDYMHLGYYHVVFSLCSAFPIITSSIMAVLLRELSSDDLSGEGHKAFLARQLKLVIPGIVVTSVLVLLARPMIELLFGQRYAMSIPLLQVMIIPFSMGVIFTPLESYFYSKRPHVVTIMKFMQMSATIVFSLLFIKTYGLIGAGYSALLVRLLGWAFLLGSMIVVLRHSESVKEEPSRIS